LTAGEIAARSTRPLLALAAALAVVLLAYLAYAVPASWFPSSPVKQWGVRDLALLPQGTDRVVVNNELVVNSSSDASGQINVAVATDFRARDYPVIAWDAHNVPAGANVSFYNIGDPLAMPVETLTFDPNVLVYKMHVGGNQLDGVSTDFLGPVQAFSSLAGGGVNYFDLKFLEAVTNNVQLFHTVGHTDPICAYTGVPAGCGISETSPTMTLTLVTAPIPEPETYALYIAGLGAAWFAKRRRNKAAKKTA